MKLKDLFQVIGPMKNIAIFHNKKEINKTKYFIEWHYKFLLDKEVESLSSQDDTLIISLKAEDEEECI